MAGVEMILDTQIDQLLSADRLERAAPTIQQFDRTAQDKLVNYIFNQQIQMRNKGLL
jgi:hypothetical protein